MTAVTDESEIIGSAQRRPAPKRGTSSKKNLQKSVTIRTPGKRGPKPSSKKTQLGVRLEPNVYDAFLALEDEILTSDRSLERNDFVRILIDAYRTQGGYNPVAPDIPEADSLAGRTEQIAAYVHPDTKKALQGTASQHSKTMGEVVEIICQRSAKLDVVRAEAEELRAELAEYETADS